MLSKIPLLNFILIVLSIFFSSSRLMIAQSSVHRIYDCLMNPRENPNYARFYVKAPDWNVFNNKTHFLYVTDFDIKDNQVIDYKEKLDKIQKYDLGDIYQVTYPNVLVNNLDDLAEELKKRDIFLFNVYGYVPGAGPGGFWRQYIIPEKQLQILEEKMGDRWLGMNNGEQDGRYVGGFASQLYPASASKLEQYLNFQRHFEKHGDDVGNKMTIMVSLNFGHYYVKEGLYTVNGAETGQALPNSQVYYAFIRGAGKQYGCPWYGEASVFNRWGYKAYGVKGSGPGVDYTLGPTKGTSLNLMKRLVYSHILYNSVFVGIDLSVTEGDKLSPLGRIQHSAKEWVEKSGQPGTMLTPVALMLDFFSGWSFPRHLYTRDLYRVWGNLPYEPGDYFTDGVIDMLYPGYNNSSYYHDESGFISPTPYGDAADCILSDSPLWLLERYPVLVVAGELSGGVEIRNKLQEYIEKGGRLFITAGSLMNLPGGLAGVKVGERVNHFKTSESIQSGINKINEDVPFELCELDLPKEAQILARCKDFPAVVEIPCGTGAVTVFASPFGVGIENAATGEIKSEIDKPLPQPFPLLKHVRSILDKAFSSQALFEVGEDLSLITCRKSPGLYTLGICNNSLREKPFQIVSHCGQIESIKELELDQSEKGAVGYIPENLEKVFVGISNDWKIAGGDTRIFLVKVQEKYVESIPHVFPPSRPVNRALTLRGITSIKEEILARPTFFDHFDRVVVDWKYLRQREKDILKKESGWISRQKLDIIVDLTSGINLYPDLRLTNNLEEDYQTSMFAIKDVMDKMQIIGSHDVILSLHRFIENNFNREQAWASFDSTLREICEYAEKYKIMVYLRTGYDKPPRNLDESIKFVDRVGASNLRLALSTALLLAGKVDTRETANLLRDKVGLWLVSSPSFDVAGRLWNSNAPIAECNQTNVLTDILKIAPTLPLVLDGVYNNQDEEYLDIRKLNDLVPPLAEK